MKRFFNKFSILLLFFFCFTYNSAHAETTPPQINAQGCALIDASTGQVLFGKFEDCTFEPASTTKVITALITLEKCNLDDEVTVQEDYMKVGGTGVGLLKGDVLTVRDLLYGLLLYSDNTCANALADHISGNADEFAKLMNAKAKELGATNTSFRNPSGMPDPEHLTTPHDLALILKEAINNKEYMEISQTPCYTLTLKNDSSKSFSVDNKNYMINKNSRYYYKFALCGKNGYTTKSNQTYVAAAEKDGHVLVASFLNALDKDQNFHDMQAVFNYGFDNFSTVHLYKKGDEVSQYKITDDLTIPVLSSKDVDYDVPKGTENSVSPEIKIDDKDLSTQFFNKNDDILKGTVLVNGKPYTTLDLEAGVSRGYESSIKAVAENTPPAVYAGVGAVALAGLLGLRKLTKGKLKK